MALGIPFDKRVRYVRECIEIVKGATCDRPFSYEGELFKIDNYDPQWPTGRAAVRLCGCEQATDVAYGGDVVADGIFMSDLSVNLARQRHRRGAFTGRRKSAGISTGFRFNNFMAWYVYDDPAEARHEARRWIGFPRTVSRLHDARDHE